MLPVIFLLSSLRLSTAHFSIEYPTWRADTLAENTTYDQWRYPCAGAAPGAAGRTDWPMQGGSVALGLHHEWTYLFINLGLGTNASAFNVSLTPEFVNVTGRGTYCIPALPLPVQPRDGDNATIQVVTSGKSGSALYNCADVTFRSSAQPLSGDQCKNSTGISADYIGQASTPSAGSPSSPTSTPKPPGNATAAKQLDVVTMAGMFGLSMVYVLVVGL
ncbi:expression library immunization antigen 1 [Apiospora phragmitis]|uniref:Expression library immunization antigen 1 n=1 Tax=Apiospora phragmitis TaxID=2905665 RepID=A0ABR1UME4_9PEZI